MPKSERLFITCNDFDPPKASEDALGASFVIAKKVAGKDGHLETRFSANGTPLVCPHDQRGYSSVFGIDFVYGPDDEDTAMLVSKRNPMVVVITSGKVSGLCKTASSKKTLLVSLSEQKDVTISLEKHWLCSTASGGPCVQHFDYSPKSAPKAAKVKATPKAKESAGKGATKAAKAKSGHKKDGDSADKKPNAPQQPDKEK